MTVTSPRNWTESAFFPDPEPTSLDGASTSAGELWHTAPQRWGHSMHAMCSYQGMFPARIAHYFIDAYSSPGDVVLDPFCGRGTTVLEARLGGRVGIGVDLNPLAFVLSRAKAQPASWKRVMQRIDELEREYTQAKDPNTDDAPPEIRMLFDSSTLSQLLFVRSRLTSRPMSSWQTHDFMIAGAIAGILHGKSRSDGSSAYLSVSMPNTFSMSPRYVGNFIKDQQLIPPRQDLFALTRSKLARLYLDGNDGQKARVFLADAVRTMDTRLPPSSVDLLVTSPPYLRVVNYGTSNWIRLWWLGIDDVSRDAGDGRRRLDSILDHRHNYGRYRAFMGRVFDSTRSVLRPGGTAIFVIGDVAEPGRPAAKLAVNVWRDVGMQSGLRLAEVIEDTLPEGNKVSRIWGKTRGRATDVERILILHRSGPRAQGINRVSWDEPYKDAGPDAAHELTKPRP